MSFAKFAGGSERGLGPTCPNKPIFAFLSAKFLSWSLYFKRFFAGKATDANNGFYLFHLFRISETAENVDMIKFAIVGDPHAIPAFIQRKFPEVRTAIGVSMGRLVLRLQRKIKEEKLSGQVLQTRTGTLRRSISSMVEQGPGPMVITGIVGTNKIYAAAHEYGARINIPEIFPKKAKALAWLKSGFDLSAAKGKFKVTGQWTKKGGKALGAMGALQYATHTKAHPVVLPERSFMRTALNEMAPEIRAEFEQVVFGVFKT
jgi:phage gpG-like protein